MIQKLRRKFMLVLMSVMTVFLAALLVGIYLSNAAHYRQLSLDTLRSAAMDGERARGSMPLIVVETEPNGQIRVLLNQLYFMSETELFDAVIHAWEAGAEWGDIPEQNLRYLRWERGPGRVRYAFADTYGEMRSLCAQAVNSSIIGAAAFLGLLLFSVVLSRWIIRPVQEAWNKQRQFVADASHELKTPLTVALSNVDMALTASGPDSNEKNRRRLDITKTELLRMKDLVEKLLSLARADVEDRRTAEPFAPVNFSYLLTCSISSFEPVFFDAGRRLSSEIVPNCYVTGDQGKLAELISILLDNACKYSLDGSAVAVRLACVNKKWLHLTVENDGAAIPSDALPRIFDRFFRADSSRGETSGYGLGLSIAYEISALHRGKIWAESAANHTVFHVRLPCTDFP